MSRTDFPYYNGQPADISAMGWSAVVVSVAVAFALLISLPFADFPLNLLPAIAFTDIPLVTLSLVSGGHHTALFRHFGFKELALAFGFGLLTIVVSVATAFVLIQLVPMSANPAAAALENVSSLDIVIFLLRTGIQLVGEEVLTILPLLAVLWLRVRRLGLSRRLGLVIAVIVSTAIFAAVHLPTYNWNFIQCFGGIGMARLVLTAAFLVTRNLWVSAGAHIVNDWTEFLGPVLLTLGHMPIDPSA